jgi:branched-chain amino acid transport system substrate-binding protein
MTAARLILRLLGAGGAAIALLGAGACRREGGPVTVGAVGPWHEDFLRTGRLAVQLAVEEVNRAGGVAGRAFRIEFRNDSGDAELATRIATEFADNPRILAVLGPANSGSLLAAARVYDGRLAALSPTAVSPRLRGISRWVFRVLANDSVFGIALGAYASRLGERAAVLYDNNAYGRGNAEAFRRNYRHTIVSYDPVRSDDSALDPFVAFHRANRVNLVYVAGVGRTGVAYARAAARAGFRAALLGTDTWQTVMRDSSLPDGTYIAMRFSTVEPRPEVAAFVRAFRQRFGSEPDGIAAFCYDAAMLLARALAEGGTSREAVRDWLASRDAGHAEPGVTGRLGFTPEGDPVARGFTVLQVRSGALVLADAR